MDGLARRMSLTPSRAPMPGDVLDPATARLRAAGAVLLLLAAVACGSGAAPPPARAPLPPVPALPPLADVLWRDAEVCVADEQGARDVPARHNMVTGDLLVDGRPFAEAYPTTARYAAGAEWYVNNEPFRRGRYGYVKYGLPRVVRPHEMVRAGEQHGVLTFTEPAEPEDPPLVLYMAVRPWCEFQAYQRDLVPREGDG